jgi:hypothetical protein
VKLFDAVSAEYTVRVRRHLAAGLPHAEAHRRASLETIERRRATLEALERASMVVNEPPEMSQLAAHGWELAPGVAFPSAAEHERGRPKPPPSPDPCCRSCRGTTFWIHTYGGPPVCSRCHPPQSPRVVRRTVTGGDESEVTDVG